jgi:dCMP deaminase
MKEKFIKLYLDIATRVAELSYAQRLKVGAIVVKDDRIISMGYNGMPSGWDNDCEYVVINANGTNELKTKPEVLHAEMNALMKLAKNTESGDNSSMFLTHSPCLQCSKAIYQAGIRNVYYRTVYRETNGIDFLKSCKIEVTECKDV